VPPLHCFTQATVFYICDSRSGLIQARRPRRRAGRGPAAAGPHGRMGPVGRAAGPGSAAGQVRARRRSVTTPSRGGPCSGPAPAPRRPVQWRRRRRRGLHWWPRRACRWMGERRWEGGGVARVWLGGDGYGDYGLDLDRPVRRNSRRSSSRLVNTSLKR
jgi:hypothetical protein